MSSILYLAWRYLAYHRVKTTILVMSITLIIYLPVGLRVLVRQSERELTTRAESTPLVIGAKGSPLELVLNTLYFESDPPATMRYSEAARVNDTGLAKAIPLYTRFRSRTHPIVGTTLDYFDFRGLRLAHGRHMGILGECVLGADAAAELDVAIGAHILSSPESVFDIAGIYPLKMRVTGVLERSSSPDDKAVFVDVRTAWVIEGLGHGHDDLTKPEAAPGVLRRDGNRVVANASVVQYNEITRENVAAFHFHGTEDGFPITAIVAVPADTKSGALLQGRYLADDELVQIVAPIGVIDELLDTILTIQRYVVAAVFVIGLSTLATAILVFMLSLRLRRREILTMVKIGGTRLRVVAVIGSEIVGVLAVGIVLAAVLTVLTSYYGADWIRNLIIV